MNDDDDLNIRDPDFVAETTLGEAPRLRLSGSADTAVASALSVLTERLHAAVRAAAARECVVDVRRLEFISAAALNAFVGWVANVSEQATGRYKIRFLANAGHHWQRRSLDHLVSFGPKVVVIEW